MIDYLAYPHLLSRQSAFDIAIQRSLCASNSTVGFSSAEIHLLHVKNDTLFSVDERTMKDLSLASGNRFKNQETDGYIWEVAWDCYFSSNKEYGSQINFVDAVTGKLLE